MPPAKPHSTKFTTKLVNIKFVLLESSRLGFLGEFFSNLPRIYR